MKPENNLNTSVMKSMKCFTKYNTIETLLKHYQNTIETKETILYSRTKIIYKTRVIKHQNIKILKFANETQYKLDT